MVRKIKMKHIKKFKLYDDDEFRGKKEISFVIEVEMSALHF